MLLFFGPLVAKKSAVARRGSSTVHDALSLMARTIEVFCGGLLQVPKLDLVQLAKVEGQHVPQQMMGDIKEWGITERIFHLAELDPLFLTGVPHVRVEKTTPQGIITPRCQENPSRSWAVARCFASGNA